MKQIITIFFLLLHLLLATSLSLAGQDLLIRSSATPENPWLGQKVTVFIDVLVAGGWAQAKNIRNSETEGGYLLRYETQGTRLNETIGGKSYSGQRYEFFFFAQRAGKLSIPEIPLDIEVKNWANPAASGIKRRMSPAVPLTVRMVPGLESQAAVVSTTEFKASQVWKPETGSLQPGDGVSRSITLEGRDISAMLFPPLAFPDIDGMGVYPGEPELNDSYQRGELTGKRLEKVSYMMEQGGGYELPALEFLWWDVHGEKVQKITLPGRSLTVSGGIPKETDVTEELEPDTGSQSLFLLGTVMLLLIAGYVYYRSRIKGFFSRLLKSYRESEQYHFQQIAAACRRNDPKSVLRMTMQWLDHAVYLDGTPARLDQFIKRYGDPELQQMAGQLLGMNMSETGTQQLKSFYRELAKARASWKKEKRRREEVEAILPEIGLYRKGKG